MEAQPRDWVRGGGSELSARDMLGGGQREQELILGERVGVKKR